MVHGKLIKKIKQIGNPTVLVIGDFMVDSYIYGTVDRVSPDAPVPLLKIASMEDRPGGAGSVAMALAKLGANVICIGILGGDDISNNLRNMLSQAGIDVKGLISVEDRPTTLKQRFVGLSGQHQRQQLMRVDKETTEPIDNSTALQILELFDKYLDDCQIISLQDYNKGTLPSSVCQYVIREANRANKPVLVDPAPGQDWCKYRKSQLIKPNRKEAGQFIGKNLSTIVDYEKAASVIMESISVNTVVITLDIEGTYLKESNRLGRLCKILARDVYDVTGAGDVVLAALSVCNKIN